MRRWTTISSLMCVLFFVGQCWSQDDAAEKTAIPKPPTIPDEPKTVDPAKHVAAQLAQPATVKFDDSSLREIATWIQTEHKIPVLFDGRALATARIAQGEPVTDSLNNEPLYLLLNRLRSLKLSWYVEDEILRITTVQVASERMTTQPYNLGDLLDKGLKQNKISDAILLATDGPWEDISGEGGGLEWLGDVLFVRQTNQNHRQVSGLLAALRKHGRRTFILDPPQHGGLREKLAANVTVNFADTPLNKAVEELAALTKADIRLDFVGLQDVRVRDREPVTLSLTDRPLSTTLKVLLSDLSLTYLLRDGVLWLTSRLQASEFMKAAVYDVRDLCRNGEEADALGEAILNQTSGPWQSNSGEGGDVAFAQPGALVVRHTENVLNEVDNLLATYRKALLASKPRDTSDKDEVSTRYYRTHQNIAKDLSVLLPLYIEPKSWLNEDQPKAIGTVMMLASKPQLVTTSVKKTENSLSAIRV